ncbi:MAG: extracellular solute-binding protein [Oscillospiraceae bacterium]|nr:extracellular solute-binding protein [Oscillospiraceae bacterium]
MDKTRKIRRYAALSAAFVFAFSNASLCTFNEVSASEDPFSYEIEYTEKRSYHDYYSEYSSQKPASAEVIVKAEDHLKAENGVFEKKAFTDAAGVKKDALVWNSAEGTLSYKVEIPETAVYCMDLSYAPVGNAASTELSVSVDGEVPFDAASRITLNRVWVNEKEITVNSSGNQIRPAQVQQSRWCETSLNDPDGLYNDPLLFYLEKGTHEITFEASRAYIALEYIKFYGRKQIPSYKETKPSADEINGTASVMIRIEGEDAAFKSDSTLYPTSDNASYLASPADPGHLVYNTIGDNNWQKAFQTITWEIPAGEIKSDGWYRLGIKARQRYMRGFNSARRISVDGAVPCSEFENVRFRYDNDWQNVIPRTDVGEDIYVYLTAGEGHTITMEAVPGDIGEPMRRLEPVVDELNEYYRRILMITGPSPDKYTDYNVDRVIPEITGDFKDISGRLKEIKKSIEDLTGFTGSEAAGIERMYVILDKCTEKPARIPMYLSQLKDNIAAISSWMRDYRDQPLEIDYIEIASADAEFSPVKENFFSSLAFGAKAFWASFKQDYSLVSGSEKKDALDVWVSLGRDQALAVKELVESEFTPVYDIPVNISIVQGGVVEAALAGKGPDVALFLGGEFPVNLAARGLLERLDGREGFDEAKKNFHEDAMTQYTYDGGVYGMPLSQSFPVMFYRKDILTEAGITTLPETWDDLVEMMPALQRNNLHAGLVLPSSNISASTEPGHTFALLMLQNGLGYYNDDMSSTTFDSVSAVQSFEKWTDLYTDYRFEQVYDPFSRFRDGTYPIVIQNYTFCNQLKSAAPELNGLWGFTLVPGTELPDGTVSHAANSAGSGAVVFTKTKNKDDAWQFLKWFTSTEVQSEYGTLVEGLLGTMGRCDTANTEALSNLSWTPSELKILEAQRDELKEIPVIPASYAVTRNIMTAFRETVNSHRNPRDTIMWYNRDINTEIKRKLQDLADK